MRYGWLGRWPCSRWLGWLWLLGWSVCVQAAPALLLAENYRDDIPVHDYLVSEKLDGVRAYWDGQQLWFRSGRPVKAPDWFVSALPAQPLDGELWLGRGRFEEISGLLRRERVEDAAWRQVKYMIFELPDAPGPFAERVAAIKARVAQVNRPWVREIEQFSVVDRDALQKKLRQVVRAGGEGLMLHRADALYQTGRSDVLLKLKVAEDAEAIVIAHQAGQGKYSGMLGALRVQRADGAVFSVGSGFSDAQRRAPPAIGASITYRFRGLTEKGLPRFPTFLRVRDEP